MLPPACGRQPKAGDLVPGPGRQLTPAPGGRMPAVKGPGSWRTSGHFNHHLLGHFTRFAMIFTNASLVMMSVLTCFNRYKPTPAFCPTGTKPRMPASARSCRIFPRHQDVEITTPAADSHKTRKDITRTHHLLNAFRCSCYIFPYIIYIYSYIVFK